MTDVRRVATHRFVYDRKCGTWGENAGIFCDDPNGTHALLPWEEYERLREQLRLANLDAAINEARANDLEQSRQVPLPRGKFKDEEMIYSERFIAIEDPEDSDE